MKDLSLHILDIAQNSLTAGTTLLDISLILAGGTLTVTVADNGRGMPPELAARAADPFATTRLTRRLGLGLPLWKLAAEQTGGVFSLSNVPGRGVTVTTAFQTGHIDMPPPGDMAGTLVTLIQGAPDVDIVYTQGGPDKQFVFDTREFRKTMEEVPLNHPDVLDWARGHLREQMALCPIA